MCIAHLIRRLAAHLTNDEYGHGDNEGDAGDNGDVEKLVRNSLVIRTQHVPHK